MIHGSNNPNECTPSGPIYETLSFVVSAVGVDITAGDTDPIFAPYNFTLLNFWVGITEAPTGSSASVGLKKNGARVDSSPAVINENENTSLTGTNPTITTSSFLKGDAITPEIVSIGATTPGQTIKIYLEIQKI